MPSFEEEHDKNKHNIRSGSSLLAEQKAKDRRVLTVFRCVCVTPPTHTHTYTTPSRFFSLLVSTQPRSSSLMQRQLQVCATCFSHTPLTIQESLGDGKNKRDLICIIYHHSMCAIARYVIGQRPKSA